MVNFIDLKPTEYSYERRNVSLSEMESSHIKTRPTIIGFDIISIKFNALKEHEYIDLIEFFEITTNYGLDNFLATFEFGNEEEYSFYSNIKVSYPYGTNTLYNVEFKVVKYIKQCEKELVSQMQDIEQTLLLLKNYNNDYDSQASCSENYLFFQNIINNALNSLKDKE